MRRRRWFKECSSEKGGNQALISPILPDVLLRACNAYMTKWDGEDSKAYSNVAI